jgi:hypothetical protein
MDLATITEEDEDTVVSIATEKEESNKNADSALDEAMSAEGTPSAGSKDTKKERKKKAKGKDAGHSATDYDTAQQILIDLCTEMKDLKKSMQESHKRASENLDSNQHVVMRLADQMEMLRGNMKQLDRVIESKATPKQIEDMARVRAVQEIVKAVTDDKERTVGVYEEHARRGYEEIERLRHDLDQERGEVAALRAELEFLRGERKRASASGTNPMLIDAGDSVGGGSEKESPIKYGAMYINGGTNDGTNGGMVPRISGISRGDYISRGDFDDMTLDTKESYETSAYEMKSLKKRIIHMKKKLAVAQLEAKETGELRVEVEKLRVQSETEKKASQAKDNRIKLLEDQIKDLICAPVVAMSSSLNTTNAATPPLASMPAAATSQSLPAKPVAKSTKLAKKWWEI